MYFVTYRKKLSNLEFLFSMHSHQNWKASECSWPELFCEVTRFFLTVCYFRIISGKIQIFTSYCWKQKMIFTPLNTKNDFFRMSTFAIWLEFSHIKSVFILWKSAFHIHRIFASIKKYPSVGELIELGTSTQQKWQ